MRRQGDSTVTTRETHGGVSGHTHRELKLLRPPTHTTPSSGHSRHSLPSCELYSPSWHLVQVTLLGLGATNPGQAGPTHARKPSFQQALQC
jgi:hypothetical protein